MLYISSQDSIVFLLQPKFNNKNYRLSDDEKIVMIILGEKGEIEYNSFYSSQDIEYLKVDIDGTQLNGKYYYYFYYKNIATGEKYNISSPTPVIFFRSVTTIDG